VNRRRVVLCALALVALCISLKVEAQQDKVYVIGWISPQKLTAQGIYSMTVVRAGLRERGWVEGSNFVLFRRDAGGDPTRLDAAVAEIIQLKPDVIVTFGLAAMAARRATETIPIVIAGITDPVNLGLVPSLARPGGNVTGVSLGEFLRGKLMQIFKEMVPEMRRVAILDDVGHLKRPLRTTEIPPALGLEVTTFTIESRRHLEQVFVSISRGQFDAVYAPGGDVTYAGRHFIGEQALKLRLPSYIANASATEVDGLLFSYTANIDWHLRRIPIYVDRILRGAKPADLPIEQSDEFDLTINLKTAKALGLTIPPSMLLRANRVIE
jgi:putative ABC transport system substrate-binding protein